MVFIMGAPMEKTDAEQGNFQISKGGKVYLFEK